MEALLDWSAMEFREVPIEALEIGKESNVHRMPIEDAHGIVGIEGGDELVAGIVDGLEVAGSYIAPYAGDREVQHRCSSDPPGVRGDRA
jgi:hypothetical protein